MLTVLTPQDLTDPESDDKGDKIPTTGSPTISAARCERFEWTDSPARKVSQAGTTRVTLGSPAVDFNYDITSYVFHSPGVHKIEWRGGGIAVEGLRGLHSNVVSIVVDR